MCHRTAGQLLLEPTRKSGELFIVRGVGVTSELGRWLRAEMDRRGLGQNQAALATGVAQATISDVINKKL